MITVSATKLKEHLFEYLDKVAHGEVVVIEHNKQEIARLVAAQPTDWRDKMTVQPKLLVPPEEIIAPIEGVWEDYI